MIYLTKAYILSIYIYTVYLYLLLNKQILSIDLFPHSFDFPKLPVAMVSHDSLERAEKRLGVPAVLGRFHQLPRQLADDYELSEKVIWGREAMQIHKKAIEFQ